MNDKIKALLHWTEENINKDPFLGMIHLNNRILDLLLLLKDYAIVRENSGG